jgi:hypothetical protein
VLCCSFYNVAKIIRVDFLRPVSAALTSAFFVSKKEQKAQEWGKIEALYFKI